MADVKPCPWCAEEILAAAKKCKHCGEFLEGDSRQQPQSQASVQGAAVSPHVCTTCGADFDTSRNLYLHKVNTHGEYETDPANRKSPARPAGSTRLVCPHCQQSGGVRTKQVKMKKGISGGKATGAVLTGGFSILATGLSRKEKLTEAHCSKCSATWRF